MSSEARRSLIPKHMERCKSTLRLEVAHTNITSYRTVHGWIKLILIRKVTDIAAIGINDKNKPERFEKAFKDIPRDAWHVFEDPGECRKIVIQTLNQDGN